MSYAIGALTLPPSIKPVVSRPGLLPGGKLTLQPKASEVEGADAGDTLHYGNIALAVAAVGIAGWWVLRQRR